MTQIPGLDALKEIFTGSGKRQNELIKEYKSLITDSPEEAKKILEMILRIIKQEQFMRSFVSISIVAIVLIYSLSFILDKYINKGEVLTKESAIEFLNALDDKPNFNLQYDESKIGITRKNKIIGYLSNSKKNDFLTIVNDTAEISKWKAQNNSANNLFEAIELVKRSGNINPKITYPAYQKGEHYAYRGLNNFWFKIGEVTTEITPTDTIFFYDIYFGEGKAPDISWIAQPKTYTNTPDGLGNINDAPPSLIEKNDWQNTYIVCFGIGFFLDNRVYRINSEAHSFAIKDQQ